MLPVFGRLSRREGGSLDPRRPIQATLRLLLAEFQEIIQHFFLVEWIINGYFFLVAAHV
jgi:hypothetical protein